ncbi:MAG: YceD family protein, partial [Sphingopyxis sp.]
SEDLDLLPLEGDRVDLGDAAVQTLSLALDPFPRHPDATRILVEKGVLSEEAVGPFAALAKLRGKPDA